MECHLGKVLHRLEVRAGTNNIVCEVEENFDISSMVQKMLDRIVQKIKAFPNVQWCVQGEWTHLISEKEAFNDHLQSLADESLYESCSLPTQLKITRVPSVFYLYLLEINLVE